MSATGSNTPASPDIRPLIGTVWEPKEPSDSLVQIRIEEIIRGHPLRVRVSRLRPDTEQYLGGWDISWRLISVGRILSRYRPIEPPDIYRWISSVVGAAPLGATRYDHILSGDSVAVVAE